MSRESNPPVEGKDMQEYFSTLPAFVQESILQSGVKLQTEEQLRQFVSNLNKKSNETID